MASVRVNAYGSPPINTNHHPPSTTRQAPTIATASTAPPLPSPKTPQTPPTTTSSTTTPPQARVVSSSPLGRRPGARRAGRGLGRQRTHGADVVLVDLEELERCSEELRRPLAAAFPHLGSPSHRQSQAVTPSHGQSQTARAANMPGTGSTVRADSLSPSFSLSHHARESVVSVTMGERE